MVSQNYTGSRCTVLQGAVCVSCCVLTAQGQVSFHHRVRDPPTPTPGPHVTTKLLTVPVSFRFSGAVSFMFAECPMVTASSMTI